MNAEVEFSDSRGMRWDEMGGETCCIELSVCLAATTCQHFSGSQCVCLSLQDG